MHRHIYRYALILILMMTTACSHKTHQNKAAQLTIDGTTWFAKDGDIKSWRYADGLVSCVKKGGGWLTTENEYENFILTLEWKIPHGGNSGVGVRYPLKGDPAHAGMEIQVLDDEAEEYKDLIPAQYTGGIYYQVAAKRGYTKPVGEWNRYEITCNGPMVNVVLNGETVLDINMDEHTEGHGGHLPLSERPRIGHIGLQSHDTRVDYRNISITEWP